MPAATQPPVLAATISTEQRCETWIGRLEYDTGNVRLRTTLALETDESFSI